MALVCAAVYYNRAYTLVQVDVLLCSCQHLLNIYTHTRYCAATNLQWLMTFYDIEGCTHCVCTLYIMIIEMVCACVFVQSRTTSLFARLIYLFMYFDSITTYFRIFTLRKLLKLGK